jgi:hypothetical protein
MATDQLASYASGKDAPATAGFAVTPNDSVDLTALPRALYVGTAGNLSVVLGGATLTFVGVSGFLPIRADRVRATGTTATDIIGLY